jgi:hypothetical protein
VLPSAESINIVFFAYVVFALPNWLYIKKRNSSDALWFKTSSTQYAPSAAMFLTTSDQIKTLAESNLSEAYSVQIGNRVYYTPDHLDLKYFDKINGTFTDVTTLGSNIWNMGSFGSQLIFVTLDKSLYKSDGTAGGTIKIGDLDSYTTGDIVDIGTHFYFFGKNSSGHGGVWKSNGNVSNLTFISTGIVQSTVYDLSAEGGEVNWAHEDKLYQSDGSSVNLIHTETTYPAGTYNNKIKNGFRLGNLYLFQSSYVNNYMPRYYNVSTNTPGNQKDIKATLGLEFSFRSYSSF